MKINPISPIARIQKSLNKDPYNRKNQENIVQKMRRLKHLLSYQGDDKSNEANTSHLGSNVDKRI